MAWTTKKGFNFRSTLAFTTDNAGELCIPGALDNNTNLMEYSASARSENPITMDSDTFSIGSSVGTQVDGARNRTANDPSSSDHRLAGRHGAAAQTMQCQFGIAAGQYKLWVGFGDASSTGGGLDAFKVRDSNGAISAFSGLKKRASGQFYDIRGNLYSNGAAWAAAADGGGLALTLTTTDTSNGNGGPMLYIDNGTASFETSIAHIAVQYLGAAGPTSYLSLMGAG